MKVDYDVSLFDGGVEAVGSDSSWEVRFLLVGNVEYVGRTR